jgi:TolB-like protein
MRKVVVSLIVVGLILTSMTISLAGIDQGLNQAKKLYAEAKFVEAIELLISTIEAQKLDPAQAQRAYLLLARCFYARENQTEAKMWLGKLRQNYPCLEINSQKHHRRFMGLWYSVAKDSLCQREDPGIKHIAVVDFRNNSTVDHDKWEPMQFGMADILISNLKQLSNLKVVDRERVQMILDEIQVQQTEYFDDKTAVRVGKMLGVHVFVMGSFMQIDKNEMLILPKLVKTETGEVLKSETIKGKPKELLKMLAQTAETVAGWLEVVVTKEEQKALHGSASESTQAALAYSRGVLYEDEAKYAAAREEYQKALAVDSTYYPAIDRLEALAMSK